MNTKKALLSSIKYNAVAIIPSVVGISIVVAGLYLLIGQPITEIIEILNQQDIQWILKNDQTVVERVIQSSSYILAPIIIVIGYFAHRVGRTFLLFYFTSRNILEEIDDENVENKTD